MAIYRINDTSGGNELFLYIVNTCIVYNRIDHLFEKRHHVGFHCPHFVFCKEIEVEIELHV